MTHALAPVRTVAPASMPVTRDEAKAHLRVGHTEEDTLIDGLIAAATAHLDGWTGILGRCLITQTWRQDLPGFGDMRLPLAPVAGITSITYWDSEGTQITLDAGTYRLIGGQAGAMVALTPGATWPGVYSRPDAVSVTFTAGAATAPTPIKLAILLHVGHLYANREAVGDAGAALPLAYEALTAPFRRVGV